MDNTLLSFPISNKKLKTLDENDLETIVLLDKNGFLPGSNESFEDYKIRLLSLEEEITSIKNELINDDLCEIMQEMNLKIKNLIDPNNFHETEKITERYSFSIRWAIGFYTTKTIGLLAGGATIIFDNGLPLFLLKSSFKNKKKWFLYTRQELLAHELCHIARASLSDKHYEEFFAYRLSPSKFRRYFGSFFHSPIDSLIMLIPFFLLLAITIANTFCYTGVNDFYFWIICFIFPTYLFIRNIHYMNIFNKAYNTLMKLAGCTSPESILFRCTASEIKTISKYYKLDNEILIQKLKNWSHKTIRWKIILKRFI
jgi:hypothetical protein